MPIFILDTDHVSLFQRRHPSVMRRVRASPPERIAVTVVTFEEQMRGWLNAIRQSSSGQALVAAYSRLHGALAYYQAIQVLDLDAEAYECFQTLRNQKIRIGTQDLRISAVALTQEGIVVTRNTRDFSQVPGLSLEDWTQP